MQGDVDGRFNEEKDHQTVFIHISICLLDMYFNIRKVDSHCVWIHTQEIEREIMVLLAFITNPFPALGCPLLHCTGVAGSVGTSILYYDFVTFH